MAIAGRKSERPAWAHLATRLAPGVAAGSAGGIIAALVSLPLKSPHDSLMNSGTIAVASLAVTAALAFVWVRLAGRHGLGRATISRFAVLCAVLFGASLMAALAVQLGAELERTLSYVAPLSAIQFGVVAAGTPGLARVRGPVWALAVAMVVVLLVIGFVMAGHGDQPSGVLELPPR